MSIEIQRTVSPNVAETTNKTRVTDAKTDDNINVAKNDEIDKSGNEVLNQVGSELSELQESRINGILDEFKNNPEYSNEHDVIDELLNIGLDEKQVEEKLFGKIPKGTASRQKLNYDAKVHKNAPEYLDVRLMPKTQEEFEAKKDYYVQAANEFANLEIKNGTVSEDKEDQAAKIKDTLNSYTKDINELQKHNPLTNEDKLKLETFKVIHNTLDKKYNRLHTSELERAWKGFQETLGNTIVAYAGAPRVNKTENNTNIVDNSIKVPEGGSIKHTETIVQKNIKATQETDGKNYNSEYVESNNGISRSFEISG